MSRRKRKNSGKNQTPVIEVSHQDQSEKFFYSNYSKASRRAFENMFSLDPYTQNMFMKDMNMSPRKYSREKIEKLLENPHRNEEELRSLSEYISYIIMQYKRVLHFYGSLLTFDYYPEPTNADEDDMKTPAFKKSYKKMNEWIERLNPKKTFSDIMRVVTRVDTAFFFVRENKDSITFQEMPFKYCKIISKTEYGYEYAFDMSYFFNSMVSVDEFAPEFKEYLESYRATDGFKNRTSYWIALDPLKAPVFKFDENVAGIVPPFIGLLMDAIDINEYKDIYKKKSKLEILKIILNQIPLHNDSKGTQAKNNFAIDGAIAGEASARMQSKLDEVKVVTSPFETQIHEFAQQSGNDKLISAGNDIFFDSAAVNPVLFGKESSTSSGVKASIKTSELFVSHMYPVFERFINAHLKKVTGRYRWKIHFEGTEFDREERFERALKGAQYGMPLTYAVVARGSTVDEFINLTNMENAFELKSKLSPLVSSHTMNGDNPGKQMASKVTDSGEKTRDYESNEE